MRKIICVSFPRSGHHLLVNFLFKYFSRDVDYPELKGEDARKKCDKTLSAGELHYCEFYNHCKSYPCIDPAINFQKNHDSLLDMQPKDGYFYIIMYRHPLESIVSLYKWNVKDWLDNIFTGKTVDFSRSGWERFANNKIVLWKNFVRKWIIDKDRGNYLFISYEELIEFPKITMINVLKFMNPGMKIDLSLLSVIINKLDINPKNNIKDFKYFSESFFKELEAQAKEEIGFLDLESKFI